MAIIFIFILSKYLENHLILVVDVGLKKLGADLILENDFLILNHHNAFLEGLKHLFGFFLHFFNNSKFCDRLRVVDKQV